MHGTVHIGGLVQCSQPNSSKAEEVATLLKLFFYHYICLAGLLYLDSWPGSKTRHHVNPQRCGVVGLGLAFADTCG